MYNKRGAAATLLIISVLVVASAVLFGSGDYLTGAVTGLQDIVIATPGQANSTHCGNVSSSLTLTANVQNYVDNCFEINASNVVLDCQGYWINYSKNGSASAINSIGFDNVTIKNCIINEATTNGSIAVYLQNGENLVFRNNTITVKSDNYALAYGKTNQTLVTQNNFTCFGESCFYPLNSVETNVTHNSFSLYGAAGDSIIFTASNGLDLVENNSFDIYVLGGVGIRLPTKGDFVQNRFYSNSTQSQGLWISSGGTYTDNFFNFTAGTSQAIVLQGSPSILYNNNFSIPNATSIAIQDDSNETTASQLIYNNSFGKIEWVDNGSGSYARSINLSSVFTIGLGHTFLISNLTAAINLSRFNVTSAKLNNSVQITLNTEHNVSNIFFQDNFTENGSYVRQLGADCLDANCIKQDIGRRTYIFNASSLGSWSLNTTTLSNTAPNVTTHIFNSTTFRNHTDDNLFCYVTAQDTQHTLLMAYWTILNGSGVYANGSIEIQNGSLVEVTNVSTSKTNRLENWTCRAYTGDGVTNETDINNKTITISDYTCGDSVSSSLTLTQNITGCSERGLNITANNVVLDCAGFYIQGNGSQGVYASNVRNLTVKNCRFQDFINGTHFTNVHNLSMFENTFHNHSESLNVYDGINISILNNNFTNATSWYINVWDTNTSEIRRNRISSGKRVPASGAGVYLVRVDLFNVFNNTITELREYDGIYLSGGDEYNRTGNITYNNISFNPNSTGIEPSTVAGEKFYFSQNYIYNNSIGYDIAAFLFGNATHEQILYNTKGIKMHSQVENARFTHSIFEGNDFDVQSDSGPNYGNVTIVNSTINRSRLQVGGTQYVYVRTWVTVNVTDENGNARADALVQARNSIDTLDYNTTTNSNGIATLEVMPYYHNNRINYLVSPSTITATFNNYTQNSSTINFLNSTAEVVNFTLISVGCSSTVKSDFEIGNNYVCNDKGINFEGAGKKFFGENYNMSGNSTGIGLNVTGSTLNEINNLWIQNFGEAIYLKQSNGTRLFNITITNSTKGIIFNNSNNNTIYDAFFNTTSFAVIAENAGNTNNSLVNVSIAPSNVSVTSNASVYLRWYVDVNVTLPTGVALPNVDVRGLFNETITVDRSGKTGSNGVVRLELAEWKKNSTDVYYITPHNITVNFSYLGSNTANATSINLSVSNNTIVQLNLNLNCTGPADNLEISSSTSFCPGTYVAGNMNITADNVTLTCDGTTIDGSNSGANNGINVNSRNNVTMKNCKWTNFFQSIEVEGSSNITISGHESPQAILQVTKSESLTITNSTFQIGSFDGLNKSVVTNNQFGDSIKFYASTVDDSYHTIFTNNTYNTTYAAISISEGTSTYNTSFYYNTFKDIRGLYVDIGSFTTNNDYNWNTTVNGSAKGNNWEAYCDKGADDNSDGYADNESSSGAADYPFNGSTVSLFRPGDSVTDWGPVFQECVTEVDVATGATTTSGGGASTAGTGGVQSPAPAPAKSKEKKVKPQYATAEDIAKNLQINEAIVLEGENGTTIVEIELLNKGNLSMSLFPSILQDIKDTFYIVSKRTLGFEGSFFDSLASLSYSKQPIAQRLLKSKIVKGQDEILLGPGEKAKLKVEVEEGLVPSTFNIEFSSLGQKVGGKKVASKKQAITGTAIDLNPDENTLDLYAIFVPGQLADQLRAHLAGEKVDLAPVEDAGDAVNYYLELSFLQEGSAVFSDYYGPYTLSDAKTFVFAQQFKYQEDMFDGKFEVQTKVFKEDEILIENMFPVTFQ